LHSLLGAQLGVRDLLEPSVVRASVEPKPREQAPTPKTPVYLVDGDAHEPRREARRIGQARQIAEGCHEGILQDILGVRRARQQAGDALSDGLHVTAVEHLQGEAFAGQRAFDQVAIGRRSSADSGASVPQQGQHDGVS
jgi:hypothetical protein